MPILVLFTLLCIFELLQYRKIKVVSSQFRDSLIYAFTALTSLGKNETTSLNSS